MPPPYPVFEPGITPHTKAAATAQSWRGVKSATVISGKVVDNIRA
jgi:hypothetical protein